MSKLTSIGTYQTLLESVKVKVMEGKNIDNRKCPFFIYCLLFIALWDQESHSLNNQALYFFVQ